MASQSNFAALVAPMSHVERVAVQEAEHSFLKQQTVQQLAAQNVSKDAEQVQQTEANANGQKVRSKDEKQDSRQGRHFSQDKAKPEVEEPADGATPEDLGSTGVWSGNILNLKV